MIDGASVFAVKVTIDRRRELEGALDAVVDSAIEVALRNPGHGILVTRHDRRTFTVELAADVPEGTIAELDRCPPV